MAKDQREQFDKNNFLFTSAGHSYVMMHGELMIDAVTWPREDSPEMYVLARRVAMDSGCFRHDASVPDVVIDQ